MLTVILEVIVSLSSVRCRVVISRSFVDCVCGHEGLPIYTSFALIIVADDYPCCLILAHSFCH